MAEAEVDRLTSLPINLLEEILSRTDFCTLIRTSVLSKSWNDVWKGLALSTLYLTDETEVGYELPDGYDSLPMGSQDMLHGFLKFMQTSPVSIHTISVILSQRYQEELVREVLLSVLRRSTVHLFISIENVDPNCYPPQLFSQDWLQTLNIQGSWMSPMINVNPLGRFGTLRELVLYGVGLEFEEVEVSLEFVVLKLLKIDSCRWIGGREYTISAPEVTTLFMNGVRYLDIDYFEHYDSRMTILLSNVTELDYSGGLVENLDMIGGFERVETARIILIDLDMLSGDSTVRHPRIRHLIDSVASFARELTFSTTCFEDYGGLPYQHVVASDRLRKFQLYDMLTPGICGRLMDFLHGIPNLEFLGFDWVHGWDDSLLERLEEHRNLKVELYVHDHEVRTFMRLLRRNLHPSCVIQAAVDCEEMDEAVKKTIAEEDLDVRVEVVSYVKR